MQRCSILNEIQINKPLKLRHHKLEGSLFLNTLAPFTAQLMSDTR